MSGSPIDKTIVDQKIKELRIPEVGKASIREIVALVNLVEEETGEKYIRMEMGVPGLPPAKVGTEAEIDALKRGVGSIYPMVDGIKPLKEEAAKFVRNFMNIDVHPKGCIPTVGSMQGTYVAFLAANNIDEKKDTALFIDPGFPVQKQQMLVLGQKYATFDVFSYRGEKLRIKLEEFLSKGNIHSIIYSNPNNPSWICFTEDELKIIGELANKYDVIVMEDLAYFGMDFRRDLSEPGKPPFQPTVAKYTNNFILFISSSKIFSYAGQRIGVMVIPESLFDRDYPVLQKRFHSTTFGSTITLRLLYSISSGTSHSAQWALTAMLKAVNEGSFNFVDDVKEYGEKAKVMKRLFLENGFDIVYKKDIDQPIADGFYFTISYPGMTGNELVANLIYFGISAIALDNTGSLEEGIRACVSFVKRDQFEELEKRLKAFNQTFSEK
ncbi:aminotransferase class I/II-fold pyridoxal phosphate-dependent enzyme [Maribellus comscasis]|uniref:Aminotransferase class I/II-fold pyridoxal phosphate-dependent enzyme n=1 Tax=Maribellus comscasis TaxID=2681766 RepID=A0A6I6JY18_9BACT|nr:pyridoxal phosphate-dependent aminotransferase [Maribellus comscasis]QGY47441.1 aminotransferase class I/II-fold pyridoxal phosphate-dependent enzyme [Maribellus comscasis]